MLGNHQIKYRKRRYYREGSYTTYRQAYKAAQYYKDTMNARYQIYREHGRFHLWIDREC